jgi:N-acetylmuramoyl-L-alanine amidase
MLRAGMNPRQKNLPKCFARLSLGFASLAFSFMAITGASGATAVTSSVRREAANSQFARSEDLRAALNAKAPEKRTLAEYRQVVSSYRRVYLITPHAAAVPDALLAVAELNAEMGDRFGRSYYQTAVDSYEFLIREYPASKFVQDAMLRVAQLQKDQLGDPNAAQKSYQDFQKRFPHSAHRREVQEALAELALMRNSQPGAPMQPQVSASAMTSAPVGTSPLNSPIATGSREDAIPAARTTHNSVSGGEKARTGSVPRIEKIRSSVTPDGAEITIALQDSVQYTSGRIANPDRIYFDLHAARLSPGLARENIKVTGNLVTQVRVAQNKDGIVRVVLDVDGVKDYAASLMQKPSRLVIELYGDSAPANNEITKTSKVNRSAPVITKSSTSNSRADAASLPDAANLSAATAMPPVTMNSPAPQEPITLAEEPAAVKAPSQKTVTASTPSPSKSLRTNRHPELVRPSSSPQPTRDGQSTLTRALGLKIGRIVIDAGHGGHDTGTIGATGLMEKDLCLDVALRLGKLIQQKLPNAEIVYTRSDDTFIPLEERTHIANEAKADLFISIHANSSPDHGARGVETYYLNLKGSADAMEVAARENAVSQESIHDLEEVVKKIARTEKIDESKELAEDIQDSLSRRIQKTARPVRNRGVRKAPFVVLIGADMPSILTEISFLSNPADEQLLKKPEHRQHIAEGVYQGVATYLQNLNSMNVNLTSKPSRATVVSAVEESRNQK